ncbi:MAG TPA: hypothetical protein VG273_01635 [Bryobacteraceae bacterium]|jgi:hypothetical protein|nr:hypothetical protein [Bryobacteraceae bacterium]
MRVVYLSLLSVTLTATACFGASYTVGCSGAPAGTYSSTTLTGLFQNPVVAGDPNPVVRFWGTCTENFFITGFNSIDLGGGASGAAINNDPA